MDCRSSWGIANGPARQFYAQNKCQTTPVYSCLMIASTYGVWGQTTGAPLSWGIAPPEARAYWNSPGSCYTAPALFENPPNYSCQDISNWCVLATVR